MPTLDELLVKIDASTELLRRELKKGEGEVSKFEKGVDYKLGKVDKRFQMLGSGIKRALGAIGLGLGVSSLVSQANQSLNALEEVGRQADSLGASVESIQELTLTFREFDLESNDVSDALGTIADRAQDAQDGMKSFIDDFKLLGVSVDDLKGKRPEELFALIARRVAEIEDPTRRTAGIVRIFGDDLGRRLSPLLLQGEEGLRKYAERWQELGAIVDEAGVRNAAAAAEKFRELSASISGKFTQFVADNAETIERLADALLNAAKAAGDFSVGVDRIFNLSAVAQAEDLRKEIFLLNQQLQNPNFGGPERDILSERLFDRQKQLEELRRQMAKDVPEVMKVNAGSFEETGADSGAVWLRGFLDEVSAAKFEAPEIQRLSADRLIPELTADQVFPVREVVDDVFAEVEQQGMETSQELTETFSYFADSMGNSIFDSMSAAFQGIDVSFSDLLGKMAADLATSGLLSALGGLIGGPVGAFISAGIPGRASGGPIRPGKPYVVGERGPELVVPDVSGRVINAAQTERMLRGGGGSTVNQEFNIPLAFPPQLEAFVRNVAGSAGRDAAVGVLQARQGRI